MIAGSAIALFASLTEDALARKWSWRDRDVNVREALYLSVLGEQEAVGRARRAARLTEPGEILVIAQRAFGDLRGLLVGLPAALLDAPPAPTAWTIRQVLEHMIKVERRYAIQTRYAIERDASDPVRIPDERLKSADDVDVTGDVADVVARFAGDRAETWHSLSTVPIESLTRPTVWAGYDVDVRFRLHRFGAHIVEHTIQCEKTLDALGCPQEEGRRIVRRLSALRGELEALDAPKEIEALDARHAERATSVRRALA
jgi:DinB superfamily